MYEVQELSSGLHNKAQMYGIDVWHMCDAMHVCKKTSDCS